MRRALIIGAGGFIGSHYTNFFRKIGLTTHRCDIIEGERTERVDVRLPLQLEGNFSSDDVVINLAAIHRTPGHPDQDYFETNIRGAENVCVFAEEKGINNIIFTSSIAPYGASEELKTEDSLPTPNTPYGISKLVAEHIHREWVAKDPNRKLLIVRPGVVFGKSEKGNFTRLASAIKRGYFFYPGRRDTIKACIYVKDLVEVSWRLLTEMNPGVDLYNFTYEPAPTIETIAKMVAEIQRCKSPKIIMPGATLRMGAGFLRYSGLGNAVGIHPDRVKKLMTSTNISGKKLQQVNPTFAYGLEGGIKDWYKDCERQGLF